MGIGYSYEVQLKASYSRNNIKQVLQRGVEFGFRYFPVDSLEEFNSLDAAIEALMTINVYYVHSIRGQIDGHIVHIVATPRDPEAKELGLVIGDFYEIDTVYYMKIFVNMIRNFAILDIQIFID